MRPVFGEYLAIFSCVVLLMILPPGHALSDLPPRPTAEPTGTPTVNPTASPAPTSRPRGASIRLEATFPATWPWSEVHWQTPWTAVEWQDAQGDWHLVEGWQGQFDTVEVTESVVGVKPWWLAPDLYGAGPFRWVVYAERGGDILARSAPFTLPGAGGQTTSVVVRLP